MSNDSLSKPSVSGIGRGNLPKAIRSHFFFDDNVYQDCGQPMTQREQQLCDKAVLSALKDENGNGMAKGKGDGDWKITTHICDDVEYIYMTPSSMETALDFLAKSIQNKDFNDTRIAVVCEHAEEAAQLMRQLGKRSIGCLLLIEANEMIGVSIRLWTDGLLNSVLVVCDDMLVLLAECSTVRVNYLIHSTQPLLHIFQRRIQMLIPTPGKDTQVLVIRSSPATQWTHVTAATASNGLAKVKTATGLTSVTIAQRELTSVTKKSFSVTKPPLDGVIKRSSSVANLPLGSTGPTPTGIATSLAVSSESMKPSKYTWQLPSERHFEGTIGSVYTYNIYNIFAWSRCKQTACFNIRDVANIGPKIKGAMEKLNIGHVRAKSVQRFAWPHVAAGRSLCVIGNELVGKTWCYLPTLCHRFNEEALQRDDSVCDFGPSCIILCATATQGEQIANWCMDLLGSPNMEMELMVKLFSRSAVAEVASRLRRPCGILITNAEQLMHLFKYNDKTAPIFNPLTINCVAFDNFDALWRAGRMDCEQLIQRLLYFLDFKEGGSQLFIVGRLWTKVLMSLVLPQLQDLLLLFQDALEASVFCGHNVELLTTSSQQNEQDIIELLQCKKLDEERVVLACHGKADASKLSKRLFASNINNIIIDPEQYSKWSDEHTGNVLIIFDDVIPRFRAENIDCLLHYKYTNTWARFKARYSIFYGNSQTLNNPKHGTSIIHVCAADVEQVWLICDFIFKHDRIPPDSYLSVLTEFRNNLEVNKPRFDMSLCRQLLSYGNCYRHSCQYRHMLWDYETGPPNHNPRKRELRFHVITSLTPAHLSVRFTEYKVSNYFLGSPITKLGESIQLHYEDPLNHRKHMTPKAGDLCVVKLNKQYQRVGVIRVCSEDRIEIKQLDLGTEFMVIHASELLVCEGSFVDEPFEANDLRITGLTPLNMERIWPEDAKRLVRQKFFNRLQGNRIFTANVDFAFHETIFVNNVYGEDGNDLKSFVFEHILAYCDEHVKTRLKKVVAMAKPFCHDTKEAKLSTV